MLTAACSEPRRVRISVKVAVSVLGGEVSEFEYSYDSFLCNHEWLISPKVFNWQPA